MKRLFSKMTPRERTLALLVGGTLFLIFNVIGVSSFIKKHLAVGANLVHKRNQWEAAQQLLLERQTWITRREWLLKAQRPLLTEGSAGVELLDSLKAVCQRHSLTVVSPAIGSVERHPTYASVSVTFETKSPWNSLIGFLHELQSPETFIVLENVDLEVDPADSTRMRGVFRIARWYAP